MAIKKENRKGKYMNGIKLELFGIALILLGIACSLNNVLGYSGGILGFGIVSAGLFFKK
jgi:hypothetical protein